MARILICLVALAALALALALADPATQAKATQAKATQAKATPAPATTTPAPATTTPAPATTTSAPATAGATGRRVTPKKILMQGLPFATSHHMVLAKIGRELVARGHEVHFVRSSVDSDRVDTTGLNVHTLQLNSTKEHYAAHVLEIADDEPLEGALKILREKAAICERIAEEPKLLELMKTMDVALVDPAYLCSVIYSYAMNIPIRVDISPVNFYGTSSWVGVFCSCALLLLDDTGLIRPVPYSILTTHMITHTSPTMLDPFMSAPYEIPQPWATVPQMGTKFTPDMTFGQRLFNSISWAVQYWARHGFLEDLIHDLNERFRPGVKLYDSFQNASFVLFPTSPAFDFPRQLPPNCKMIGPILPEPAAFPFAQDPKLSDIVANAKNGIVLVSFGTLARLKPEQAQALADAVATLKQTVIWKYNGEAPRVGKNTILSKWIPQNDLLGHPNTKLFIAHGGANGILEAAYHGVPILGYPLFGDQWDNVARAVWRGMAISVDKDTATTESLVADLDLLLNNPTYQYNAKLVSSVIRDTPRTPVEQAADWIEYAIKYEGAHFLKMPSYSHPWYINQGWDVGCFWLALAATLVGGLLWTLRALFRCVVGLVSGDKRKRD
ncbi:uncharacterized protein MONBRDRAFT_37473 [Monosiga brevicollis MX1]|uniref:UDP-glycosyltransferases domain-containing protein n=1 Tax=Monosiga brevicollis TaxID=81824 RepID=A9V1Y8_MONBE|nr:uncharacterized protein MONBRDRAFT_37473 [Monosiga brevicollis MX1]EDQ88647.1 predicted protein [Monosiga brevicollis MX1]|eukprot:XP_001746751.1 hypothetical protein [Monosiga brevicollis MX1]